MNKGKFAFSAWVCTIMLLGAGCATTSDNPPAEAPPVVNHRNVFDFDGLPSREYYVGGGYVIRYIAKEDGTLYAADDASKRLLATVSLQEGEKYETKFTHADDNAVIKLYFVPKSRS